MAAVTIASREEPAPEAVAVAPAPRFDVGLLQGAWELDLAATPEDDAMPALFGDRWFRVVPTPGCAVGWAWAAHPDGVLVLAPGASASVANTCRTLGPPPWVPGVPDARQVVAPDDRHLELLDEEGEPLAYLSRITRRPASAPAEGAVADLPADLVPPTPEQLLGTWYEQGLGLAGRSVRFDDRTWTYSQSVPCNARTDPYSLSDAGGLAHLRDPLGRVRGCDPRLPGWLAAGVARVGLDGDVLVLLDADGREVARLDRASSVQGTVLEHLQGEWVAVDLQGSAPPNSELWLRVDGEWLRHAFNASCNTADDELRLSGDGWVVGSRKTRTDGCAVGGQELLPGIVARVVVEGDRLSVLGPAGGEIRRFERAAP